MKVFADASFLYNAYYPEQVFSALAQRLWQRGDLRVNVSMAVILEFRIGALWEVKNEEGWKAFQRDKNAGRLKRWRWTGTNCFWILSRLLGNMANRRNPGSLTACMFWRRAKLEPRISSALTIALANALLPGLSD